MRKLILAAGAAALAITAPVAARPDKGGGQGGGHAQVQKKGGGGQKAQRGGGGGHQAQAQRAERRGGGERRSQRVERRGGGERQVQRMERRGGERHAQRIERRGGSERQASRIERRGGERRFANFQSERGRERVQRVERTHKNRGFVGVENRGRRNERIEQRGRGGHDRNVAVDRRELARVQGDHVVRVRNFDDVHRFALHDRDEFHRHPVWRDWDDHDWDHHFAYRGLPAGYVGCPPGLAKKAIPCVPPGLARNAFVGTALPAYYSSNYLPIGLRDIYYDTPDYYYRWGDGYIYRVNRTNNLIAALLPLIGAGYGVGQYFPYYNQPAYYVPSYYQPFYPDTPYDYYRYDDGYVYRIDAGTGLIEDVVPLLDRGYGVGQLLPAGYSYYNVPYQYRDYYYDTPDYYYRYAPGAIYQVDRDTQLITAIASLLTGGLAVGQPLPPAYSVYNVPLGYRDMYYDRPDAWYRYSDGYIYQVDPATRLITAIVTAALV